MFRQTKRGRTFAVWAVGSAMLLCATTVQAGKVVRRKSTSASVITAKIKPVCIRYAGQGRWSLQTMAKKVRVFYRDQFGYSPRVTAFGQTATHDQMGFDHRHALDIGVHPDSPEGQALMDYLREQKIPFIAIRKAIPGSATAPHIHIGHPSSRTDNTATLR